MSEPDFRRRGVHVHPGFLEPAGCERVLASVANWRADHAAACVHRHVRGRDLRYQVIDGEGFGAAVAGAATIVEAVRREAAARWCGPLTLIDDHRAACNVNITPPGGSYRWHYDRNRVTALLYLNTVAGGETELHANHRLAQGGCWPPAQRTADRLFATRMARAVRGGRIDIAPAAGTLVLLRGDRTLHSVRPVTGTAERINIVLAFDTPGAPRTLPRLNEYLYRSGPSPTGCA